jgi:hypothetical protein
MALGFKFQAAAATAIQKFVAKQENDHRRIHASAFTHQQSSRVRASHHANLIKRHAYR